MSYKLFIDDERFPADNSGEWEIARTSMSAINTVIYLGMPSFISFDHDLYKKDTAIPFINWLTDELIDEKIVLPSDFAYDVHSQNPIGRDNIRSKMDQLIRHFKLD